MERMNTDDGTWVEYLEVAECWLLLSLHPVGRVGVLVGDAPEIYPVNHVVDGESVVFRTDDGTKLHAVIASPQVSFEADGLNVDNRTGWSVLVKGRAVEITDADELAHAALLPLQFWGIGAKSHWIRVVPTEVSGRAIRREAPDPVPFARTPGGVVD